MTDLGELYAYLRERWEEEIEDAVSAARHFESAHRERWQRGRGPGASDVLRRGRINLRVAETHDPATAKLVAANDPAFVIADRRAKLKILELHESFPVHVSRSGPPEFKADSTYPNSIALYVSRQMEWMSMQQYVERFGESPPTSPIVLQLAQPYAHRPDFRDEWRAA